MVSSDTTHVVVVEAFESFYDREYRKVVALAYALSGSRSGAEDLAQEAFIAAHQRWDRIGGYDKPGAWVRRVVANMAISAFRRRTAERKALERLASQTQIELPQLEPEDEQFWNLVRDLPGRQTQAITLFYLEDRSINEISEILGCSPNTAKVHLFRGRQALATRLGLEAPVEP
ncbi:MAG TPA: SigE family RNA polymerase sigma factor [Acidimicrobiia bacterium]|nr:SigE family RNA polymerase sigma factor [Acidimicrobiia bacterium]